MTTQIDRHAPTTNGTGRIYSPELLAHMQDLLAELADLDCTFEKDIEAAKTNRYSEPARLALIKELHRWHDEQHARIAAKLAGLERQAASSLQP